jgi:hypothetical protein
MAVRVITPTGQQRAAQPQQREEEDFLDKLLKGIGVANQITGVAADISTLQTQGERRGLIAAQTEREKAARLALTTGKGAPAKVDEDEGKPFLETKKGEEFMAKEQFREGLRRKRLAEDPKGEKFKAGAFAVRASNANKDLEALVKSGFEATGLGTALQTSQFFPEMFKAGDVKRFEQAKRNFINALLRRESGANITDSEFFNANKQYFPEVKDTPEVLAQKARNRAVAVAGLEAESGPALAQIKSQLQGKPLKGTTSLIQEAQASDGLEQLSDAELNKLLLPPQIPMR